MSVDVVGVLAKPVSLASVLERTVEALKALLGLDVVPELAVIDGWHVKEHLRVSSGQLLDAKSLEAMVIGDRIPAAAGEMAGSLTFEVDLVGVKDRAFVMVTDLTVVEAVEPCIEAIVSPTRTCVGVVLATAVALGAAIASDGEFVDIEIVMLDGVAWEPAHFIELARLTEGVGDFGERCEQFMRQFPHLEGWPKDRSTL